MNKTIQFDKLMDRQERQDIVDNIVDNTRNTVGYSESEDKGEFMKGAMVGIDKAMELMVLMVDNERKNVKFFRESTDFHRGNIETVAKILSEYQEETDR